MSETDRIARMESALTGVNAWKTGWRWNDRNGHLIYATPKGRDRDLQGHTNRDMLLAFSDTLCGRHGNLLKHIRDHDPLHGEDRWSDVMLSLTRYNDPEFLRSIPDDPQGFRDRWTLSLDWPSSEELGLLGEARAASLVGTDDTAQCHRWAVACYKALDAFREQADGIICERTAGWYRVFEDAGGGLPMSVVIRAQYVGADGREHTDCDFDAFDRLELVVLPDSYDWRRSDPMSVHATVGVPFHRRPNDGTQWNGMRWYRTPERFAGRLLRNL